MRLCHWVDLTPKQKRKFVESMFEAAIAPQLMTIARTAGGPAQQLEVFEIFERVVEQAVQRVREDTPAEDDSGDGKVLFEAPNN